MIIPKKHESISVLFAEVSELRDTSGANPCNCMHFYYTNAHAHMGERPLMRFMQDSPTAHIRLRNSKEAMEAGGPVRIQQKTSTKENENEAIAHSHISTHRQTPHIFTG